MFLHFFTGLGGSQVCYAHPTQGVLLYTLQAAGNSFHSFVTISMRTVYILSGAKENSFNLLCSLGV